MYGIFLNLPVFCLLQLLCLSSDDSSHHYIACYKPALMLSSWTDDKERAIRKHRAVRLTLANLQGLPQMAMPISATENKDIIIGEDSQTLHLVGRLDRDSEGLLLLTTDGKFTAQVLSQSCTKTYWALVRGEPSHAALEEMRRGGLNIRGAITRSPLSVRLLDETTLSRQLLPPPALGMDRAGTWIELVLNEGRNRQVRRITAAAGHPTIRLCRVSIGGLELDPTWKPGECHQIDKHKVLPTSLS